MQQHTIPTPYMVGDVHVYTAEMQGELVLFDTGPPTAAAMAALERAVDLERLRHIFVTHCHVDHYGLADELAVRTKAQIYLPKKDALKIEHHERRMTGVESLLLEMGFDAAYIRRFRQAVEAGGVFPAFPRRYQVVEESSVPADLGVSWLSCPGHSQSDLVYFGQDWAITGDTLLRDIFQAPLLDINLDTFSGRFRNYDAYCASLRQMKRLRGRRILPGHRVGVDSLEETVLFYVGKLLERAGRIRAYAGEQKISVVVRQLFDASWDDPFLIFLKTSEVVFMKDFLARPERLREGLVELGLFDAVSDLYAAATCEVCRTGSE